MPPSLSPRESATWGQPGRIRPRRTVARQASRSKLSQQSNPRHPGHLRSSPSAGIGRAARHRRNAASLISGIIALGLIGLCLRVVPTVLTDSELVAQITGPLTGIPAASPSRDAPATSSSTAAAEPSTPPSPSVTPVKLQAKRKAKALSSTGRGAGERAWHVPRGQEEGAADNLKRHLDPLRRTG